MRPRNLLNFMLYAWALTCAPSWTAAQSPNFQPPDGVPSQPPPVLSGLSDELWKTSRQGGSNNSGYNSQTATQPGNQLPSQPSGQLSSQPSGQPSGQPQAQAPSQSGLRPSAPARINSSGQANGPQNNNSQNLMQQANNGAAVQHAFATQTGPQPSQVVQANAEIPRTQSRTPLQPKSKSDDAASTKSSGGTAKMLVSIISSLVLVIGLFLGVALLYRKSISTTLGKGLPKNVVQVLGKTTIAPRQQLVLVRFGSKLVLVSMLQGEARTLSEITDPLEVDQLAGFCESGQSGSMASSFREILVQGVKA